jgi:DNA-binding response OmpR family regulator
MTDRAPAHAGVVMLEWPGEGSQLAHLVKDGTPVLLLVAADAAPPAMCDRLTDWIRLPADPIDIRARVATLIRRAKRLPRPELDSAGIVRRGHRWTSLTPIDARLLEVLLAGTGGVVGTNVLRAAGWPAREPDDRAVARRLAKIRQRIAPLGMRIYAVATRGYTLEINESPT